MIFGTLEIEHLVPMIYHLVMLTFLLLPASLQEPALGHPLTPTLIQSLLGTVMMDFSPPGLIVKFMELSPPMELSILLSLDGQTGTSLDPTQMVADILLHYFLMKIVEPTETRRLVKPYGVETIVEIDCAETMAAEDHVEPVLKDTVVSMKEFAL